MRLKTFVAPTMTEAMRRVRVELGPDAVIISTVTDAADGVQITAAIENPGQDDPAPELQPASADVSTDICAALDRHGMPQTLADRLLDAAETVRDKSPEGCLAGAIETVFRFDPLSTTATSQPVLLAGPPGTGKTSVLVKLAAQALLKGIAVRLLTTDTVRAGAVAQLEAYGERLGLPVTPVPDPQALAGELDARAPDALTLIDTTGINPYEETEMDRLQRFTDCAEIHPVLVMDAGRNADDAAALAKAFRRAGPGRLIVTGLDIATRFGGILAAAEAGETAFAEMSRTPHISDGLEPASAGAIARLFLSRGQAQPNRSGADARKPTRQRLETAQS
jgi:flagellar biosynthesis protein FlhF